MYIWKNNIYIYIFLLRDNYNMLLSTNSAAQTFFPLDPKHFMHEDVSIQLQRL